MRFKNIFITKFIILFILMILASCSQNKFNSNTEDILNYLKKAQSKITLKDVKEIDKDGGTNKRVVEYDIDKCIAYLNNNRSSIENLYNEIKKEIDNKTNNHVDALYVLSGINRFLLMFTGDAIEDYSIYLEELEKIQSNTPSEWILNNFFGPLLYTKEYIPLWESMNINEKMEVVVKFIQIPEEQQKEETFNP
mgnify:CR=1 FL=1